MQARRVVLLLAITAISALALFLISLLDPAPATAATGAALGAAPDTLSSYEETVIIGPDGNIRVEISAVIEQGGELDLLLPFDFEHAEEFTILSGPVDFRGHGSGLVEPTTMVLGRRMLNLALLDTAAPGDTVRVSAHVPGWFDRDEAKRPFGEFHVERRFTNFSGFVMRDHRMSVVLPPGMVVHAVEKVTPGYDPKKNPEPPYAIDRRDGRVRAVLRQADLAPAASVRLDLGIRPQRRGWIPLVIGIAAALLYLVFFRDVLKPKEAE